MIENTATQLTEEDQSKDASTDTLPIYEAPLPKYVNPDPIESAFNDNDVESKPEYSPTIETTLSAMSGESTSFAQSQVLADMAESERRRLAIEKSVWGVPKSKETIKELSQYLINAPLTLRTDGEAVAHTIRTTHTKPVVDAMGEDIDVVVAKRANTKAALKNLGEEGSVSYTKFMTRPDKGAVEAGRIIAKNNPAALAKLSKEEDTFSYSGFMNMLEFVNPLGGEDKAGQDSQFWDTTKRIITGDISYSEIDGWMESNYGENWESRWASFLAKEAIIDGVLLGLAATAVGAPLAGFIKVGRTATLGARFKAAMGRAVVIGVGGGAFQVGQNMALGRQDASVEGFFSERTAYEMGGRAVGYAGAEGLTRVAAKSISAAGRGIANLSGKTKREAIAAAAKDANVKPLSKSALSKVMNQHEFEGSPSSVIILNSLEDRVKNYNAFIGNTTEKMLERRNIELQGMGQDIRNTLSDLLGVERGAIDNIEVDMLLPDITKMGNRFDSWAKNMPAWKNQNALSQGFSTRLYGSMRGQFENGTKDFELYLRDAGLVLRREDVGIANTKKTMIGRALKFSRVGEPVGIAFQSATNYLTARNFTNRVANGLRLMYQDATKGLKKEELNILDQVLKEGNANNVVYKKGSTSPPVDMSDKLWEAYAKMRFSLDMGHEVLDKAKVTAFKGKLDDIKYGKVFKAKDGRYVQISSKQPTKKGEWEVKEFDNNSLSPTPNAKVTKMLSTNMQEITTIVPYRNGHIPRVYNPHKYSVIVLDPSKGQVSREALFDSSQEAAEYVSVRNSDDYKNNNEIVMQITNNAETGFGGFRMGRSDLNLLDSLSDAEQKSLTNLLHNRGIDEKNVRLVLDVLGPRVSPGGHHNPLTDLGTAVSKEGKELRKELAKLKAGGKTDFSSSVKKVKEAIKEDLALNTTPTREAIVDYFGTVAHSAGFDNWRVYALDDFLKRYEDVLQAGSTYAKPIFNKASPTYSALREKEATRFGSWLERNITQKTWLEKKVDRGVGDWAIHLGQRANEGSFAAKTMLKVADKMPITNAVYGTLRFVAASPKLLTLNIPQLAIQASQALVTASTAIAKNPAAASKAITKLPMMGIIHTTKKFGDVPAWLRRTDTFKAYEDLVQSGYASDLYTTDTLFGMRNNIDPSIGRKFLSGTSAALAAPFRGGEAINRVSAFLAVREQTISAIKKAARLTRGKDIRNMSAEEYKAALKSPVFGDELYNDVLGFDGKIMTKADIGSAQFREAVVDRAQVLALNMSKAGQLEAMSGPGSVLLQFKQVLPKQLSVFDSSALTRREKWAAAGGLVTFWGGAGIPMASDLLNLADYVNYEFFQDGDPSKRFLVSDYAKTYLNELSTSVSDDLESAKFLETFAKRGAIAAFSDNEINVISRVALGNFVTDMVDIQNEFDFVVSFAVLDDMLTMVEKVAGSNKLGVAGTALVGGVIAGKKGAVIGAGAADLLLNPYSYMELLSRVSSGQDFNTAVARQFEPDSIVGQYLASERTGLNTTLGVVREVGKVYSQAGSWSRIADAEHRYAVNPDAHWRNPLAPKTYVSSTLRGIPVEQNEFRDLQLKLGFTPGKIVEEYNKQDLQRAYNKALKKYRQQVTEDFRDSFGVPEKRSRIRREAADTLFRFREHMEGLGLEHSVPRDVYKSLIYEWFGIESHAFTGGKLK